MTIATISEIAGVNQKIVARMVANAEADIQAIAKLSLFVEDQMEQAKAAGDDALASAYRYQVQKLEEDYFKAVKRVEGLRG